jgi:hypothetical protein
MKKAVLLLAGIFFTLSATAQQKEVTIGNGMSTRDVREVPNFDKLEVSGPFEVRLVSGKTGSVIIEGEKNLTGFITTKVEGNTLSIAPESGRLFKSSNGNKIIIKVPFDSLSAISLTGSGQINSKAVIQNNIKLALTGSGSINLEVAAEAVDAVVTGSGGITLNGKTSTFNATVTGSGNVKAQDLAYTSGSVNVTGSGSAVLRNNEVIKNSNGMVSIARP